MTCIRAPQGSQVDRRYSMPKANSVLLGASRTDITLQVQDCRHLSEGVHPNVALLLCIDEVAPLNGPLHSEGSQVRAFQDSGSDA